MSGGCLLVERNSFSLSSLTFVTLPFSFFESNFCWKKKQKLSFHSTQLLPSKINELLSMLLSLRIIFSAIQVPLKTTSTNANCHFQLKGKRKDGKSQRQFVGHLQQSKNRHLLIRRNLKFDFSIRTSNCYITKLTLLHSTPFISFPFVNITKLTD